MLETPGMRNRAEKLMATIKKDRVRQSVLGSQRLYMSRPYRSLPKLPARPEVHVRWLFWRTTDIGPGASRIEVRLFGLGKSPRRSAAVIISHHMRKQSHKLR